MDMMLLGETILNDGSGSGSTQYFGFWMPAGGNDGIAGVETFLLSAANAFTIHLETKSSDADDTGAASIGNVTLSSTSPQLYKFDVASAKDLVRYRVDDNTGGDGGYVHLQFAQPMWSPN